MWAVIKSDFKEFVSSAAEETTAVASKVGVPLRGEDEQGIDRKDGDSSSVSNNETGLSSVPSSTASNASVAGSSVAGSLGGWSGLGGGSGAGKSKNSDGGGWGIAVGGMDVKGLTSMFGGSVENDGANSSSTSASSLGGAASSFRGGASGEPAPLSSYAAAQDDDDEEELGWDDDDDDLLEEGVGDDQEGEDSQQIKNLSDPEVAAAATTSTSAMSNVDAADDVTKDLLSKLQSKLDQVEKEKSSLQLEHRQQTAELVELRAKVEEFERADFGGKRSSSSSDTNEREIQKLTEQIEQLQLQITQQDKSATDNPNETDDTIASLIQEKEQLERELSNQKEQNELLTAKNRSLLNLSSEVNEEQNQKLLEEYKMQMQQLTSELDVLKLQLESTDLELQRFQTQSREKEQEHQQSSLRQRQQHEEEMLRAQEQTNQLRKTLKEMEEAYANAESEAKQSQLKLALVESELERVKLEMQEQALNFEAKLEEEVEKAKGHVPLGMEAKASEESTPVIGDAVAPKSSSEKLAASLGEEDDWGDGDWGDDV
mmetsp:Transcript_8569/g.18281  ORF Transcript_8569/g.18281 Transcript_8569/m.18281 type:complete len:543 (+) Transcript_8569:103-1731(+)